MIQYFKGDVLESLNNTTEPKVLLHICNNMGGWGKGFVTAISKKWPQPELVFRDCYNLKLANNLGDIQVCSIDNVYIINMIAQNGYKNKPNPIPLDYAALDSCLSKVESFLKTFENSPSIFCPKIGTGLAGGDWKIISEMLNAHLDNVNVYEL